MKRLAYVIAALLLVLLLSACGAQTAGSNDTVTVGIVDNPRITLSEKTLTVNRGEDAVFYFTASEGFSLTGAEYSGEYEILHQDDGTIRLTLKNVLYPARVELNISSENFVLRYEPNGGEGEAFTEITEIKYHKRPNTANANAPFSKSGATLIGWNTKPDGSGTAVGLGSRVTVDEDNGIVLYAQWLNRTDSSCFEWREESGGAVITGCSYDGDMLVIPEELGGLSVTGLAADAFRGCPAKTVVFPKSLVYAEDGCFADASVSELYFFDNIERISDSCFPENALKSIHINAAEAPFGSVRYKESCYADKLDLLILSQEKDRIVFYAGCSIWYNLDMEEVIRTIGDAYYPVNMGLNGTVNSELQLQIMLPYLHEGDIFFHTPELSSDWQMMRTVDMTDEDHRLWVGVEYNYDMLNAVDFTKIGCELDSFCHYLGTKTEEADYIGRYTDSHGRYFMGEYGEVPFKRYPPDTGTLGDSVSLNLSLITDEGMGRLSEWYARLQDKGMSVFVSYACFNKEALPDEEKRNVAAVDAAYRSYFDDMPGVVLLSDLSHFYWQSANFFDTNYHLLSGEALNCTTMWMKAFKPYYREILSGNE